MRSVHAILATVLLALPAAWPAGAAALEPLARPAPALRSPAAATPPIVVTRPAPGVTNDHGCWGSVVGIEWDYTGDTRARFDIYMSSHLIASGVPATDGHGTYSWRVPEGFHTDGRTYTGTFDVIVSDGKGAKATGGRVITGDPARSKDCKEK